MKGKPPAGGASLLGGLKALVLCCVESKGFQLCLRVPCRGVDPLPAPVVHQWCRCLMTIDVPVLALLGKRCPNALAPC
jgi:hypothetical protein